MQIISDRIDHAAFQDVSLALITPHKDNRDLHDQLLSLEDVHPVGSAENLLQYRLGEEGDSKRCFALIAGRSVLSAIYTHATQHPRAHVYHRKLPGHVDRILAAPSAPLKGAPDMMTFYSILRTSDRKGAGQALILSLHKEFSKSAQPILTTLSPLRDLASWAQDNRRPQESELEVAARYLSLKIDGVQRFHQGNGAVIGAIKTNANLIGTEDHKGGLNVMVNYDYSGPREKLEDNKRTFRCEGLPPCAPALRALLSVNIKEPR